ncbi:MAG: PDZ domain-containing protein [Acidobacteria bacterium]|nr:MAG: PDZ domain-containing protein [Acidobacteriota bacterium]
MIKQKLLVLVVTSILVLPAAFAAPQMAILGDEEGGYLGVTIRDVTADDVKELKLQKEAGVYVREVDEGSPAEKAGLAAKDVITEYAGTPVISSRQFRRLILETPPDREVALTIVRNGQTSAKTARIGERETGRLGRSYSLRVPEGPRGWENFRFEMPDFQGDARGRGIIVNPRRARLGINGVNLTNQMAEYLAVPEKEGVLVLEVQKDSPAEKAGLKAGDVIVSVDGKPVESLSDLSGRIDEGTMQLEIIREKKKQNIQVTIPEQRRERSTGGEAPRRL